jgi:hypothetical protein
MRRSPSMVPEASQDICLVLDDFGGCLGLAWRETTEEVPTTRRLSAT